MDRINLIYFLIFIFQIIFLLFDLHTFHHLIIPFIFLICAYINNLNDLKLYVFIVLSYWVIHKNNCILGINIDKKKKNYTFLNWLIGLSCPIAVFIATFNSHSFYDKILFFYSLVITNYKFNKIHNSSFRYINLFILYLIFFKSFKLASLILKIALILGLYLILIQRRKKIYKILNCSNFDKILAFLLPLSTFISISN